MTDNVSMIRDGFSLKQEDGSGQLVSVGNVLQGAIDADLESVMVLGRDKSGAVFVAASHGNQENALLVLRAQLIIAGGVGEET